jgi:hypothetical protein
VKFVLCGGEFVAGEPLDVAGEGGGGFAEGVAETGEQGVASEIPGFDERVGGFVTVVVREFSKVETFTAGVWPK